VLLRLLGGDSFIVAVDYSFGQEGAVVLLFGDLFELAVLLQGGAAAGPFLHYDHWALGQSCGVDGSLGGPKL